MSKVNFENKVVVISGSSQGIGKTIALELAKKGAIVVINGREKTKLLTAEQELKSISKNVLAIQGDVSKESDANFIIQETIRTYGKIDVLINSAGLSMRGCFGELNPKVFRDVFDINVLGVTNLTIPCLKHIRESKGSIIFISSLAGIRGLPGLSAYCASKMALRGIAESIRIEEAQSGIHVGLILIGQTQIDEGKITMSSTGELISLKDRSHRKVPSKVHVANAVIKNIEKRKFITRLTWIGKLNSYMQAFAPGLLERILIKNADRILERSR